MKQDLRISVTRRMIKDALITLLKAKPINKIKVSELCAEAHINRTTFYRHYATLQDVLHELENDFLRQIPQPDTPPKSKEDAYQRIEAICTYVYNQADMVKLLFSNKTDLDIIQVLNTFYKEFWELRKEQFPIKNPEDDTLQILLALLGGGYYSLLRKWIFDDIQKTPEEIATIMCNFFWQSKPYDLFLEL